MSAINPDWRELMRHDNPYIRSYAYWTERASNVAMAAAANGRVEHARENARDAAHCGARLIELLQAEVAR